MTRKKNHKEKRRNYVATLAAGNNMGIAMKSEIPGPLTM